MKLEFSEEALDDLSGIELRGLVHFGRPQTELYLSRIRAALVNLHAFPMMGFERRDCIRPVRFHPVQSHVIIYEVSKTKIRIARILHGRQNWRDHI